MYYNFCFFFFLFKEIIMFNANCSVISNDYIVMNWTESPFSSLIEQLAYFPVDQIC